jgi:hypothetical protein
VGDGERLSYIVEVDDRQQETPLVPLIVVRIQADTADVEEFLDRYSRYFGAEVVFLPTEGIQPPGRLVRFVFALADGCEMVYGEGVVLRMRRDTGDPLRPPGMELRYFILDEGSQGVVDEMLARRATSLKVDMFRNAYSICGTRVHHLHWLRRRGTMRKTTERIIGDSLTRPTNGLQKGQRSQCGRFFGRSD